MKTFRFIQFMTMLFIASFLFVACSEETDNDDPADDPAVTTDDTTLAGEISEDRTLSADKEYKLSGGVHVKDGATLTIEAGTVIKSDPDEPTVAYLLVEPGGNIMAKGTADKPIVFTSGEATPKAGDWGGIIITGKAPVNAGANTTSEVASSVTYGGTESDHSSGVLEYVRAEFTGNKISDKKEHNGFTFEGVGSGTTVSHLAVYLGADDGFEFFGGTVNAKYLFVYGANDDSFDWTFGWTGKGQHWVAIQDVANGGDRGIEADNNGDNNAATPFSSPQLSNITLVGVTDADAGNQALKLREGTKAEIYNLIAVNFPKRGIQVEHDQTLKNLNDGSLVLDNAILLNDNPFVYTQSVDASDQPTGTAADDNKKFETSTDVRAFEIKNVTTDVAGFSKFLSDNFAAGFAIDLAKINEEYAKVNTTTGAKKPKDIDAWFDVADYVGGVTEANDWTKDWTRVK